MDKMGDKNEQQDTRLGKVENRLTKTEIKGGIFGTIGGVIGGFLGGFFR